MEVEDKLRILKSLDTKSLIEKLPKLEEELEKALREDASFRNLNYEHLASGTNDCQAVKALLAELSAQAPESNPEGKKLTVADRDAWLIRQRKESQELSAAIAKQKDVAFLIDSNQISIEMAKKHLESTKAVLNLKRAQIEFLTER